MFLTIWKVKVSQVRAVGSGLALRICAATRRFVEHVGNGKWWSLSTEGPVKPRSISLIDLRMSLVAFISADWAQFSLMFKDLKGLSCISLAIWDYSFACTASCTCLQERTYTICLATELKRLPNAKNFAPHSGFQQNNLIFSARSFLMAAGGSEVQSKLFVQPTALLSPCHGMAPMAQFSFCHWQLLTHSLWS